MKLVRPHQVLGFLGNGSIHRRQKLRAHRRVQNVQKHLFKLAVFAGIRIIFYQMAHQRLGNPGIHPIHGHMVAVVGGPPQGKLRHIPSAHHQSVFLIGNVHQHLRPLPCLSILIGDVMILHFLTDIPEMNRNRFLNIHFLKRDAQSLCHQAGVRIGSVRGAETGHSNRHDIFP